MEITWYGQAMFRLKGKSTTLILDPFDPEFTGLKLPKDLEAQVVLSTHDHQDHNYLKAVSGEHLDILGPGEYEISGVTINGLNSYHDKESGAERGRNTIYHILMDGVSIVHLGDLGHVLTQEQTSQIDTVDILMVPVGGVYTLDSEEAAKIVAQLEARIVIPMHYNLPGLKYNLAEIGAFLQEMGAEGVVPQPKLSITKDKLPPETQVVVLLKS